MADPTRHGDVEFINEQEQEYFEDAKLGIEAGDFLSSPVGKRLWERARKEYDEAVDEMFALDPYTPEGKIKHGEIRRRAWCAEHFMAWCVEAIQDGRAAEAQMKHLREGD